VRLLKAVKLRLSAKKDLLEKAKDGSESEAVFYPMYFGRPSAIQLKP